MGKINWSSLAREFEGRNQTQTSFCREKGVSLSSFSLYLRKTKSEGHFAKVELGGSSSQIELELSGGVRIRVQESQLGLVLKALQELR